MSAPALRSARDLQLCSARALCPLVMVGDPDLAVTRALLEICVAHEIPMVELCAPFPNPFTDGATLRRAHGRALAGGGSFARALDLIAEFGDRLAITLLADVSHSLPADEMRAACAAAKQAGAAALLPHGLPPRLRPALRDAVAAAGLPVIGTLYAGAAPAKRAEVLRDAGGFVYLVSAFGRSGGGGATSRRDEIATLRRETRLPIALGFGLRTEADVAGAFDMGADIAIVGSVISAAVEAGIATGDPAAEVARTLSALTGGAQK